VEERVVGGDDLGVAAVASSPSTSPPSASPSAPAQRSEAPTPALEEEEWEIRRIVGKRRAGKDDDYKVRWKDTWMAKCELAIAKRLLQEFEAQHRAQRGDGPRKPTRA